MEPLIHSAEAGRVAALSTQVLTAPESSVLQDRGGEEGAAPGAFSTLHAIVEAAHARLPDEAWTYLIGGAGTESTLRRERHALDAIALRPRVLRDVSQIDASSDWCGQRTRLPILLAPVGSVHRMHPGGAVASAQAAARFGVAYALSSVAQADPTAVATAAGDSPSFYQIYVDGDDDWLDERALLAAGAGYDGIIFTVDVPVFARRERDIAGQGYAASRSEAPPNMHRSGLSWDTLRRFRQRHDIPVIIKGIGGAEDAELACDLGATAVYVSTHGGRQLDSGLGAMEILPEVVAAVRGRSKVIVDGGFRRGTDIVKAIACGADAVGLGRLAAYGLAADGTAGVLRVLELLEKEIGVALALLGVPRLADLDASAVRHVRPLPPATTFESAFPLLDLGRA